jgi:hypothetical protein
VLSQIVALEPVHRLLSVNRMVLIDKLKASTVLQRQKPAPQPLYGRMYLSLCLPVKNHDQPVSAQSEIHRGSLKLSYWAFRLCGGAARRNETVHSGSLQSDFAATIFLQWPPAIRERF